ncbi:MAG: MoaD/ThiS family protein [Wenzhouxiangellaceae bacterium]|nr:MoaD/ThiS family protein [Wenzhouxiangellaceae bacterium]
MDDVATLNRTVEIRLFGGFRQFRPDALLPIELEPGATVADLRRKVEAEFGAESRFGKLLRASAFATERRVLDDESESVPENEEMSLLPPVCGG